MVLDIYISLGCYEPVRLNWLNGRRLGLTMNCAAILICLASISLGGIQLEPYAAYFEMINEWRVYLRIGFRMLRKFQQGLTKGADWLSNADCCNVSFTWLANVFTEVANFLTKLIDFINKYIYDILI